MLNTSSEEYQSQALLAAGSRGEFCSHCHWICFWSVDFFTVFIQATAKQLNFWRTSDSWGEVWHWAGVTNWEILTWESVGCLLSWGEIWLICTVLWKWNHKRGKWAHLKLTLLWLGRGRLQEKIKLNAVIKSIRFQIAFVFYIFLQ